MVLSATYLFADCIFVDTSPELIAAMHDATAGDTIVIAPGEYTGDISESGDPGDLPNGKGYFWVGNDGSGGSPIVVIGGERDNPPVLQGTTIETGYVIHVTGDHVILKNLVIRRADKGVVFDNASFCIIEDCEVYNAGAELIHVRDSSCSVTISRNRIYSSGNGGRGSIGEGIYIGTDQARWGADDIPQAKWGEKAVSEGYGGYDWRVHNTRVLCNYLSGGISAECLDIKEGTQHTLVKGNMLVGDSIGLKVGDEYYDDSFIDQKGVKGTFVDNMFCECGNRLDKYIAEVTRAKYDHIPDSLTADGHSSPWCDSDDNDSNRCSESDNTIVTEPADPRSGCAAVFDFNWNTLKTLSPSRSSRTRIWNGISFRGAQNSDGIVMVTLGGIKKGEPVVFDCCTTSGRTILSREYISKKAPCTLSFPLYDFARGAYYLSVRTRQGSHTIRILLL
jgi:hypothetical protein